MNKVIKRISIILFVLFIIILKNNNVSAANTTFESSSNEIELGETITLNASVTAAQWKLNINVNGSSIANSKELDNYESNITKKFSGTYKPTVVGTYTFTLTGDITDFDQTNTLVSQTVQVKVVEKEENNNSSSGNNTTTGNNNQTTEKPKEEEKPTFKEVNETVYATQTVNVRKSYTTSSNKVTTLNKGDSLTRTGIGSNGWDRVLYNGTTAYMIHSALTTTKPEEEEEISANKALKELTVEGYELSPEFNPEVTKYSLTLKQDDESEKLEIKATPEDEKATVNITGNEDFKVGNNIVKITVTAEDETTRIYTITVSKTNEAGEVEVIRLSKLEVANATLNPSFEPDTTNYTIEVEDPTTIKAEDVIATPEDEDFKVTVAENELTENGEKIITIMLEDSKGEKTGVYQITVKKPTVNPIQTLQNVKDNTIYYILGGIIGALLILIIIIIIILRKTADKEDNINVRNQNEFSDNYNYSPKRDLNTINKQYDEMVEQSNVKSQILNDTIRMEKNVSEDIQEDYKPNVSDKKRGKHF